MSENADDEPTLESRRTENDGPTPDEPMFALLMGLKADTEVLLDLIEVLAKQVGIAAVDGMALREWWMAERRKKLDAILIHLEDKDPGGAAVLQSIIDSARGE
jgi:hypothetical protein